MSLGIRASTAVSTVLLIFLLSVIATAATTKTIIGKVVGVHDGDTLTLLDDSKRQIKIRLVEIDAPDLANPTAIVQSGSYPVLPLAGPPLFRCKTLTAIPKHALFLHRRYGLCI